MKEKILFFTMLVPSYIYCQSPVITSSWLPQSGDRVYRYSMEYKDTSIIQDTGANITWDFSWLEKKQNEPIDSFLFFNPNQVSFSCSNTLVNLVYGSPTNNACYIKNSSGLFTTELTVPGGDTLLHSIYSDYFQRVKLNFNFRQVGYDTVKSRGNNGKYEWPDSLIHSKNLSWLKYDGYGTLITPDETFDTTVRIHRTSFITDSIYSIHPVDSTWEYTKTYAAYDIYMWYVPSVPWPVLWIQSIYDLEFDTNHYDTVIISHVAILASEENTSGTGSLIRNDVDPFDIYVYGDKIFLFSNKPGNESVTYSLLDISGRPINKGHFSLSPGSRESISVKDFSKGIYIITLTGQNGQQYSQKVIIK